MRVYLVRHGQSQGNVHFIPGAVRPKTDPLTKLGQEQARQSARLLKSQCIQPTMIISSPYTRAMHTAKAIQKELGTPLIEDERLGEYNPGDWDGAHITEFTERFNKLPVNERYIFRPPNGESWLDESRRINTVIEEAEAEGYHVSYLLAITILSGRPSTCSRSNRPTLGTRLLNTPPGSVTSLDKNSEGWTRSLISP